MRIRCEDFSLRFFWGGREEDRKSDLNTPLPREREKPSHSEGRRETLAVAVLQRLGGKPRA